MFIHPKNKNWEAATIYQQHHWHCLSCQSESAGVSVSLSSKVHVALLQALLLMSQRKWCLANCGHAHESQEQEVTRTCGDGFSSKSAVKSELLDIGGIKMCALLERNTLQTKDTGQRRIQNFLNGGSFLLYLLCHTPKYVKPHPFSISFLPKGGPLDLCLCTLVGLFPIAIDLQGGDYSSPEGKMSCPLQRGSTVVCK